MNSLLALPGSYREERGCLLFYIPTTAVRALRIFLVVFRQSENCFKWLVTIKANIIVDGHGSLPLNAFKQILRLREILNL